MVKAAGVEAAAVWPAEATATEAVGAGVAVSVIWAAVGVAATWLNPTWAMAGLAAEWVGSTKVKVFMAVVVLPAKEAIGLLGTMITVLGMIDTITTRITFVTVASSSLAAIPITIPTTITATAIGCGGEPLSQAVRTGGLGTTPA